MLTFVNRNAFEVFGYTQAELDLEKPVSPRELLRNVREFIGG